MSTQPRSIAVRTPYEMVTPAEFAQLGPRRGVHLDTSVAIRAMKSMAIGEGVKIKLFGSKGQNETKRKMAIRTATVLSMPIRTAIRDGYLYLQKVAEWKSDYNGQR